MAERGVMDAARGKLLLRDRIVGGARFADLPVQAEQLPDAGLLRGAEIREQGGGAPAREGRAVDAGIQLRQDDGAHGVLGKDVDVLGHAQPRVWRAGGERVVIARRDEHRHGHAPQAGDQLLAGLEITAAAVEQIAAEQDEIHVLGHGELRQRAEQPPLLGPADRGFSGGQRFKGGVQMQIRRMQDFQDHVSRIASARRQRPVSGSISNRQPSSFAGPLAAA